MPMLFCHLKDWKKYSHTCKLVRGSIGKEFQIVKGNSALRNVEINTAFPLKQWDRRIVVHTSLSPTVTKDITLEKTTGHDVSSCGQSTQCIRRRPCCRLGTGDLEVITEGKESALDLPVWFPFPLSLCKLVLSILLHQAGLSCACVSQMSVLISKLFSEVLSVSLNCILVYTFRPSVCHKTVSWGVMYQAEPETIE